MILPPIYNIKNKNEEQMKASFVYFMGDKNATSKQISEPTRSNNYANLDKDERIIKAVSSVTNHTNAFSIKSPSEIEQVSNELLRLSIESGDSQKEKEYKNRRNYINKYKEFLDYCKTLRSSAIEVTNKKIRVDVVYDWKGVAKIKGIGTIYIRIYIHDLGERSYSSTGIKVRPQEWDNELWVVNREDALELNNKIKSHLQKCIDKFEIAIEDVLTIYNEEELSEEETNKLIFEKITTEKDEEHNFEVIFNSKYSISSDPYKPFINEEKFNDVVELLRRKKNVILEGAPGVGKTFLARKIAYQLIGEIKDENIEMIQFHQSYSYEDFVQGIRPSANGEFITRNGVFHEFCTKAKAAPEEKFIFIIDEINRGNLSKILGELMMLIEANKRSSTYAIKLTYSNQDEDKFYVPENVYILGCMNTADRSLAIVDYALRRRFAFFSLEPEFGDSFSNFLLQKFEKSFVDKICQRLLNVNEVIKANPSLGRGMEIGHSYFCDLKDANNPEKWWQDICKYELFPYIHDICFDDEDLAQQLCNKLK